MHHHPSKLPPEIHDLIIDCLYHDLPTLSNLSLTCRGFLTRARKWLFQDRVARLSVNSEIPEHYPSKYDWRRLQNLLDNNDNTGPTNTGGPSRPGFAPSIKALIIEGPGTAYHDWFGRELAPNLADYDELERVLQVYLPQFPGMKNLTITGMDWRFVTSGCKAILGSLEGVVDLGWEEVTCDRTGDLVEFGRRVYPSLQKLRLAEVQEKSQEIPTWCPEAPTTEARFSCLEELHITAATLPRISGYIRPELLRTLHIKEIKPVDVELVGTFLEAVGKSLHHLTLDISGGFEAFLYDLAFNIVNLQHNTGLQSLKVSASNPTTISGSPLESAWVENLVESISSPLFDVFKFEAGECGHDGVSTWPDSEQTSLCS